MTYFKEYCFVNLLIVFLFIAIDMSMSLQCVAIDLGAATMKIASCLVDTVHQNNFTERIIENERLNDVTRCKHLFCVTM